MDELTNYSLRLRVLKNNCFLGQATGFIARYSGKNYLVSNRHVLTCLDTFKNKPLTVFGDIPNTVEIQYRVNYGHPRPFHLQCEQLYHNDGSPRWIDKKLGSEFADIAALPLPFIPDYVQLCPLEISMVQSGLEATPGTPVYVIGYPSGISVGKVWPIWITGYLASDMEFYHGDRPVFLINASGAGGLSGAPVFTRFAGKTRFLGVHSSELGGTDSHVCVVWRSEILQEILQSGNGRNADNRDG